MEPLHYKNAKFYSMKLLVFDTSTSILGIALLQGEKTSFIQEEGGAQASETLIPLIAHILQQDSLKITDLDAIAFGCGPGAFTGLRTACSVAQGLAMGAQLPVIPIVTLLAGAEEARLKQAALNNYIGASEVLVQLDARMNEWYWAHYTWSPENAWQTIAEPALSSPEVLQAYIQNVAQNKAPVNQLTQVTVEGPQLQGMLSLAKHAWENQQTVTPDQALPLYLRNKVALTTAEREALHKSKV